MSILKNSFSLTFCAAALALSPACGDEGAEDEGHVHGDAGEHGDDAHAGHEPDGMEGEEVPCTDDYPAVSEGMTTQVGDLTVKLVSADPEKARQHVNNDWVLEVTDAAGEPVSDFEVLNPVAYMSVHGHYGLPAPTAAEVAEPGQFKLDNIRFRMRGPWEVMFQLAQGETQEMATIQICVE